MKQTLKQKVEAVLSENPKTRDCDITLTIEIWRKYYDQLINDDKIQLESLHTLPREDHISRIRRKFQEGGHYMPTNIEIVRKRKLSEELWKNAMSPKLCLPSKECYSTWRGELFD
jgi:hypothetical protein